MRLGRTNRRDREKINAMTPVSELISVRHTDLYIDGAWHPASDGQRIEVTDPATGEVISTVASASVADALEAVQAASDAFRPWAAISCTPRKLFFLTREPAKEWSCALHCRPSSATSCIRWPAPLGETQQKLTLHSTGTYNLGRCNANPF